MLTLQNISKIIRGRKIIENISLTLEASQILGFLGPNGAGKTTALLTILGIYSKDSGHIHFQNKPIDHSFLKNVGFILDSDGLYSGLTLIENLKLYSNFYGLMFENEQDYINSLLAKFNLADSRELKVSAFSKGMRQKAAFIRAILHKPKLLILDEPFDGLDPEMQLVLRKELARYVNENAAAVLLSSHNLYEVERLCTKIAIIRNGKIEVCDFVNALKDKISERQVSIEDIYFG
jgi:ABC-2 type transport system ATP-binding protein